MAEKRYTIGEFAVLTGLTEKALRLYDQRRLLPPVEIDGATGYRRYAESQIADGRLVAMLRAIDMPLADIGEVLETPEADRSSVIGRYWYRIERRLDEHRQTVRTVRQTSEEQEYGMSHADTAVEAGRRSGAFAAIGALALIDDLDVAANAYSQAMKTAYWNDRDLQLAVGIAYAGVGRLLAEARSSGSDTAHAARSAAKGLMYDIASFTWVGWDEPGIEITGSERAAGLAAARSNLEFAVELEKGDLAISRAYWMLGAHLLTEGEHAGAREAFTAAGEAADRSGAEAEVQLAAAFGALADVASGVAAADSEAELDAALERLKALEGGEMFVGQVETARRVIEL